MALILAVDDEPHVTTLLKLRLESVGHEVELSSNGEEALAALLSRNFDLLITDIMMPGMGGRELCEKIRAVSAEPEPHIFVVSSTPEEDNRAWTRDFPNVEFIEKPVSMRRMIDRIAELFPAPESGLP